ncbi:uncharacterized protein METZ01_LOCUS267489 [marine metagenome]|uniref:Uncharacterized protein n=1 Tax=marine metagenome TaxID=408172 RepID=A0A382JSJ2_9ZZZZ
MSSKGTEVETMRAIKQHIEEAARFVDIGQCALSHQCALMIDFNLRQVATVAPVSAPKVENAVSF